MAKLTGAKVLMVTGDVDPLDYGGGVVYEATQYGNIVWEFWDELQPGETHYTVYRVYVEPDVSSVVPDKMLREAAAGVDIRPADFMASARSKDLAERVLVLETVAGYHGAVELDQYPLRLTRKELEERWDKAVDSHYRNQFRYVAKDFTPAVGEHLKLVDYRYLDRADRIRFLNAVMAYKRAKDDPAGHDARQKAFALMRELRHAVTRRKAVLSGKPVPPRARRKPEPKAPKAAPAAKAPKARPCPECPPCPPCPECPPAAAKPRRPKRKHAKAPATAVAPKAAKPKAAKKPKAKKPAKHKESAELQRLRTHAKKIRLEVVVKRAPGHVSITVGDKHEQAMGAGSTEAEALARLMAHLKHRLPDYTPAVATPKAKKAPKPKAAKKPKAKKAPKPKAAKKPKAKKAPKPKAPKKPKAKKTPKPKAPKKSKAKKAPKLSIKPVGSSGIQIGGGATTRTAPAVKKYTPKQAAAALARIEDKTSAIAHVADALEGKHALHYDMVELAIKELKSLRRKVDKKTNLEIGKVLYFLQTEYGSRIEQSKKSHDKGTVSKPVPVASKPKAKAAKGKRAKGKRAKAPKAAGETAEESEPGETGRKPLRVENSQGVTFLVKMLFPGDKYGRNKVMTWGTEKYAKKSLEPGIEFYDARYDFDYVDAGQRGQFVSRYYLDTLLKSGGGGLDMQGDVPAWKLEAAPMASVFAWARAEVAKHNARINPTANE